MSKGDLEPQERAHSPQLQILRGCPVCGESRHSSLYTFEPFAVVRCMNCSLGYLTPRLSKSTIMDYYMDFKYFEGSNDYGYDNYFLQEAGLRRTFRYFLRVLSQKGLVGGSLLEIGCGSGFFLDEAEGYFNYRVGTEFCKELAEKASAYADDCIIGGIDALSRPHRFDIVVAISVIEHVYEPVTFLASICRHLKDNGAVVLVTPNVDGAWRHIFKSRWPSFKIPEHVTYFSPKALRCLANAGGFDLVNIFSFTQLFPLSLILDKLSVHHVPVWLKHILLPIPGTMVCGIFRNKGGLIH